MTLVPQLAGLVLMLAATLWQSRGQSRCRCDRHSVDQGDDPMHQDVGLRLPGGSGSISCGELIEALRRSVQLMDSCLVGSDQRSCQISVVGAGTSYRQSCSLDPTRRRLCPPSLDPSQRERPACGWRLLSKGSGRCPRRASSDFHPKRQTPFRVKK
jgi:hypothetical protein